MIESEYLLTLLQIIIALQKEDSIKPELFNSYMLLIKNISIDNTIIYTSEQNDINNQIKLLNGKLISSKLFTNYIIKVIPLTIIPKYKPLYIKLLNQIVQDYIISYEQIINTHILQSIINEILIAIPVITSPPPNNIINTKSNISGQMNNSKIKDNNTPMPLYVLFIIIIIIIIIFIILYFMNKKRVIQPRSEEI